MKVPGVFAVASRRALVVVPYEIDAAGAQVIVGAAWLMPKDRLGLAAATKFELPLKSSSTVCDPAFN